MEKLKFLEFYEHFVARLDNPKPVEESMLHHIEFPVFLYRMRGVEEIFMYTKQPYIAKLNDANVHASLVSFSEKSYENIIGFRLAINRKIHKAPIQTFIGITETFRTKLQIGMSFLVEGKKGWAYSHKHEIIPINRDMPRTVGSICNDWRNYVPPEMIEDLENLTDFFYDSLFGHI